MPVSVGNGPGSVPTGPTEHHHQAQGPKLVHLGNGMEGWEGEKTEERKVGSGERRKKPHRTTGRPEGRGSITIREALVWGWKCTVWLCDACACGTSVRVDSSLCVLSSWVQQSDRQ